MSENNRYYFDVEGIRKFISELRDDEPVVVFGVTYILYAEVIRPLLEQGVSFKLPRGSKVIHIGGWKKPGSKKISRGEFNDRTAALWGIGSGDIIDIYGFAEQMGLNYLACACGCKHAPIYSEVIVRDITTKEVLLSGQEGLMEFVTPVPHSYPGNIVLTDDIGIIEKGKCPYGRAGTRFKIIGRLKKAEVRGCGDILSSKLTFSSNDTVQNATDKSIYRTEYYYDADALAGLEPKTALNVIIDILTEQLSWFRKQPVDALIGLISQTAKKWSEMKASKELQMNGLSFLAAWCTAEHLTAIMTEGLNGNRQYVDSFAPVSDQSIQYRKAVSRGLGCHWLAGNVQVLGMFVLIESILTKNVNILKAIIWCLHT